MAFKKENFSTLKIFLLFFFVFCIFIDCNVKAKTNGGRLSDKINNIRKTRCVLKNKQNNCVNNIHLGEMIPEEYSFKLSSSRSDENANTLNILNRLNNYSPNADVLNKWADRKKMSDEQKNRWANWGVVADKKIKNSYFIKYGKIGKYNGQYIDVKATVVDFEAQKINDYTPIIRLSKNWIGNDVLGVNWVQIKYEFFKAGTDERVSVKGYTTYWDIDGNQGIRLDSNSKGIYITNNCELAGGMMDEKPYIYAKNLTDVSTNGVSIGLSNGDSRGAFTEVFEGNSITRVFTYYKFTNDEIVTDGSKLAVGGMYHSNKQVVPCTSHDDCSNQKICVNGTCISPKTPPEIKELCKNKLDCDACCQDKNSNEYYCGWKSGDDYICIVAEEPPAYTTDYNKFTYRVIDLKKPFVNRDGIARNTGLNWCNNRLYKDGKLSRDFTCDSNNDIVKTYIINKKISEENALYKVHLNADLISKIRDYNKKNNYDDNSIECIKKVCSSKFLRKSNIGLVIDGKCHDVKSESCK